MTFKKLCLKNYQNYSNDRMKIGIEVNKVGCRYDNIKYNTIIRYEKIIKNINNTCILDGIFMQMWFLYSCCLKL